MEAIKEMNEPYNMVYKESKLTQFITGEWIFLLLIFIYFSYVFGTIGQYMSFMIVPLLLFKDGFWRYLDSACVWILAFSVTYALISSIYGFNADSRGNALTFSIFPIMFYLSGRYLMDTWYAQKYPLLFMLTLPIGFIVFSGLFSDILQNGFLNESRKSEVNGIVSSATLYGVRISLWAVSIGMIFAIARNREERIYKYLLVILGVLGIICTAHLLNRTGIVLAIVTCLAIFLTNITRYRHQKVFLGIIVLGLVSYGQFSVINNSKILQSYESRQKEDGLSITEAGGRTARWKDGVVKIYSQPLGGGVFKNGRRYYAHNFWLDVSEIAGVLPLLALLICTIINLRKSFKILQSRRISPFLHSWLITLNIGFFLTCCGEPIMEGFPPFAYLYFLFWGMTSIIYARTKTIEI